MSNALPPPRLLSFLSLVAIFNAGVTTVIPATAAEKISVHVREIQKDGKVSVIGYLGVPVGQIVSLEGKLERPSKVSNGMTLHFTKVNGVEVTEKSELARWGQLIQIQNVDSLPENETIIVEGYEFLQWRGTPQSNWYVGSAFIITKVIAPKSLKINTWQP